jgi:hypothetical protein
MPPRVKEFATSNRANGFRRERDQRDGCSISVKTRAERQRLWLSLADIYERTGIDRAALSRL